MTKKTVSVAILMYNGYDYTNQLLMDLKRNCRGLIDEVVVVDNASTDSKVEAGLSFWISLDVLSIRVSRLRVNRGFVGGMNFALTKCTGDIVILLSNDVRITSPNFIQTIVTALSDNSKTLIGGTVYTGDTGWNKFGEIVFPYAEGYALAATKETWKELGGFDDRYSPSDYEDVDLSTTALKNGYSLFQLPRNMIEHLGGRTFGYNDERFARTKHNRELFASKWGLSSEK